MTSKKKRKRIYYQYHKDIAPDKYLNKEQIKERDRIRKEGERYLEHVLAREQVDKRFDEHENWANDILEYLKNNPNKCITSRTLAKHIFNKVPYSFRQPIGLAIKYLRDYEHHPIITIKGKGYMYISKEEDK